MDFVSDTVTWTLYTDNLSPHIPSKLSKKVASRKYKKK